MAHEIDVQNISSQDVTVESVFASCNKKRLIANINLSSKNIIFFVEYNNAKNIDGYPTLVQAALAYNKEN